MARADKRNTAYNDIFGRPSDRRSAATPSPAQLHMTAAHPAHPLPGPYYAAPPLGPDRRGSVGSLLSRPMSYYPPPPPAALYHNHPAYPLPPGHPYSGPPSEQTSPHEQMTAPSYPEPGPSRLMSPTGPPIVPQHYIHQWQQAQPPYNAAYVDPNERSQSFSGRTTSFGSTTPSFGDRTQSMGDRNQSMSSQSALGMIPTFSHVVPQLPTLDVGSEYGHLYPTVVTRRQSTGSGVDAGGGTASPDQELGSSGAKGDAAFAGFDQYGAAASTSSQLYSEGVFRRASRDSESNSVYTGLDSATFHGGANATLPPSSGVHHIQPRKSSESVRVMPTQPKADGGNYDRSYSFTGGARPPDPRTTSAIVTASRKAPIVYPALLSRVAEAFQARISLGERTKDGLTYAESFDGRDAVDKIAYIIKTTDRNLALLLGRALDAQKFFHDVTYDHRLRDSPLELYQFRARLASQFASREEVKADQGLGALSELEEMTHRRTSVAETIETSEELVLPCGVFTLLTDCYSPTCTRDRLCYSIACPRRLEQQARLNMKPKPGLKRTISTESLTDLKEPGTLWEHSVPQDVVDSVSDQEKKRQEAINECIYTERDFVRDMEYLRDVWIKPLQSGTIISETKRQDFVLQVFWNVLDVMAVNARLCELLSKRQKSAHIVSRLGDIYLELVPHFAPFVQYGAHQLYGKYEFEKEKSSNPAFAKFVDETERSPQSRKLELNAYLTKPTTRLARYPLLLQVVEKYTPVDHSDKQDIPKVIKMIRELLNKVNIETGKSENRFNLAQLDQQLVFKQGEAVDLRLREEGRDLIYKGPLKKRGGSGGDSAELQMFLFDHALLMVKQKNSNKSDQLKVYRKPIPLELLTITGVTEENGSLRGTAAQGRKMLMNRTSTGGGHKPLSNSVTITPALGANKQGFQMTLNHLGRKGYSIMLWAPTWASRQKWLEKIENRQNELRQQSMIFEMTTLSDNFFVGTNKVNCAAPFDQGQRFVFGTDSGVYLATNDAEVAPVRVIAVINVTQVDVLEEQGILLVLADKAVMTFWIDSLDPNDAVGVAKRSRKISSHASFFKIGDCLGRRLVCVVKSGSVSSTIKTLEPVEQHGRGGKKQPAIRKFLQGSNDALRVFKEFYIPTESSSVHFLKSKLCVGCSKGFEIVDLDTLDTQGLLDPADSSLDFVQKRENVKPIAIYRVEGDFLLCYDDFAFYVNKNGWRAKLNWLIQWEGHPTGFALHYPFVLAFEPTFIEVRHVETGALMQIIPGPNIRHLFAEAPPSTSASVLAASVRQSHYGNGLYGVMTPSPPPYGYQAGAGGGGGGGRPQSTYHVPTMNMSLLSPHYRGEIVFAAEGKVIQLKLAEPCR